MVIPVKSISELEVKSEVSVNDKILILDSVSEEARLASKDELKGDPGTPGQDGEDGAAATITVGSVSTLPAGSSATVTNSGTSSAAVLNFGIPEGATGAAGADGKDGTDGKDGKDGTDGAAATITVGTTTTLPAGSSATVTNVGTSQDAILNFGIPKGDSGTGSGDVNGPASSTDGHLAVFDGATGKIIKDGGVIPEGNMKSFTLSSTSDLATAQAAYDWYLAGKNPVLVLDSQTYILRSVGGTVLSFYSTGNSFSDNDSTGKTTLAVNAVRINFSSDTVTSITSTTNTWSGAYLRTGKDYSTPYTPEYDGSPATKKYVDDGISGITFPVTSVNGSTGAVTLTIPSVSTITVTLAAANWSSKSITVTATGVTASNTVIVSPNPSDYSDYTDAEIYCSAQGSGTLTFTCGTTPSNDIDVNVVILS